MSDYRRLQIDLEAMTAFAIRGEYLYTIDAAPASKKNSQQIAVNRATGRPFVLQSKAYREFEEAAGVWLRPKPVKPIDYPVTVKAVFYMPTRRRVDTSNLVSAVHDTLVKHGILADDNRDIIASTDGTRTYYDKEHPRVEITITPYHDDGDGYQWKEAEKRGKTD